MPGKRILSGVQSSGTLHIGNYFGMMRPSFALQEENDCYYFIANFHALTSQPDPELLRQRTYNVALDFLACGLDPQKTVFFRQSDVPQVQELAWLLSCICPMGLLQRCHSYKEKLEHGLSADHGLFAYPVLMAADILMYDADLVPVGKDQKQHLEVTRDLAIRFNERFGSRKHPIFRIPDALISEEVAVIPGLDGQKMSKSYNNTIEIFGDAKAIRKKIMSMKTDSTPVEAPKDPDKCNIFQLYKLMATPEEVAELREMYLKGGMGYGTAKQMLYDKYIEYFAPMREKRKELEANPQLVEDILQDGASRARKVAQVTLQRARAAVGLE
ncbi:MAG: tryptophan--tRNA ligase [Victivallales bacterium]|nr:tryptophan--tRNA ligase [Victivallales bacterium]